MNGWNVKKYGSSKENNSNIIKRFELQDDDSLYEKIFPFLTTDDVSLVCSDWNDNNGFACDPTDREQSETP